MFVGKENNAHGFRLTFHFLRKMESKMQWRCKLRSNVKVDVVNRSSKGLFTDFVMDSEKQPKSVSWLNRPLDTPTCFLKPNTRLRLCFFGQTNHLSVGGIK